MYVLGISCFYHDSSAALLKDGVFVAAVQEERFTRKKHDTSFPIEAINFCLKSQGITIDDIEAVCFYEKPFLKFERLMSQYFQVFPRGLKSFLLYVPSWLSEKLRINNLIKKKLKYKGDIFFVEHHMAHAASYLVSPFKKAAILTVDGVGEWTTTTLGKGEDNKINLFKEIKFPHSLGLLYSAITAYLGFSVNNSEYKVMGLAAHGQMDREKNSYYKKLKEIIDIKSDGSFRLDMSYFTFHYKNKMPSKKLCELLLGPIRKPEEEVTQRHKDISAALQRVTEDVMTLMLNYLYKETKLENLIISGGVGLNSVYNGKILTNTPFKKVWIQPDPGDGGTSVGAAAYVYFSIFENKRNYVLKDPYLGPKFSNKEIKNFLDDNSIKYTTFKSTSEKIMKTAKLIFEDNVIGWFDKGMEWGPRALGARSILSNPCNPKMQEILNSKVKHREKFRPFAPVVCDDDAKKYFKCDLPVPEATDFMLMVYPIKKNYHKKIPSVTHVDGSGRLQTIRQFQNPEYYNLIKEFGKMSGISLLINTSFNIRGEPIVCTPYDAYKCMMGTEIDYMIAGNYLIKRAENLKDMWDSEKLAKD